MIYTFLYLFTNILAILIPTVTYLTDTSQVIQKNISIQGVAPSIIAENSKVHLVFASGDSILYCLSVDKGNLFSVPSLVGRLPKLSVGGGRGPQIVSAKGQLIIAAADAEGNIYTFIIKQKNGFWERGKTINDIPDIAKEGFVSLASNTKGELYAVWLDLRDDKMNKVVGARSIDGGKSWSKNRIIYKSPDSTVCECCKPSVEMYDQQVVVMFRNWLHGNRDLHIIQSQDGGIHFDQAQKLGEGSWKLNACPMDGGDLVVDKDLTIHTVWQRQGNIFSCEVGKKEKMIVEGKQGVVAGNTGNRFIAYVNKGNIFCQKPDGNKIELGKGSYPELITTDSNTALCAWGSGGKINYIVLNK